MAAAAAALFTLVLLEMAGLAGAATRPLGPAVEMERLTQVVVVEEAVVEEQGMVVQAS